MKKTMQTFLTVALLGSATANMQAQPSTDSLSTIIVEYVEPRIPSMGLYSIQNGNLILISTSQIIDGRLAFSFFPEKEGYYAIARHPGSSTNRYIFYFKPGDDLSFKIERDDYCLTQVDGIKNTPENQAIAAWQDFIHPLESMSLYFDFNMSTFRDFFPLLEKMRPEIKAYPKADTPNARFNASFEDYKLFNLTEIANMLLRTPRTEHPKAKDFTAYYRENHLPELTATTAVLNYPKGLAILEDNYVNRMRTDTTLTEDVFFLKMRHSSEALLEGNDIVNDTVRGEFMLYATQSIKTYPGIMDYKQKYGKLLVTEDQQRRFREIIAKYDDNSAGHEAIDFKFQDVNGKQVALSDFRGKVVYVDVWATWCGPCNAEIPHLIKLEEAYHNNPNIVFMSVSVDKQKDFEKWKKMLTDKGMGGVQLFAGDRSDEIMKPYKITGIPRFMLFDKEGRVVDADAPRPSSGEIKALLDATLKK